MDEEHKSLIEAILFAAGRRLELDEIAKLCKLPQSDVLVILAELKANLDEKRSPTMLIQDGTAWKLTVREKYITVIKKVVTKTELPKSILQTLAVVAYKVPVLQSKVIKIRTNKAYDHLNSLESSAFIIREKSGRTKLIKLAPKFYEYFDIDPKKLKEKFSSAGDVEKAIEAKERESDQIGADRRTQTEAALEKPQIMLHPDKGEPQELETYPALEVVQDLEPTAIEVVEEKVGELPVYDIPKENMTPEELAALENAEKSKHPQHKHHKKKPKHKHPHSAQHTVPHVPREPRLHEEKLSPEEKTPEQVAAETAEAQKKVEEELRGSKAPEQPAEPPVLTTAQKIAQETADKVSKLKERKFETEGIEVTPEMETEIERKVRRILGEPEEKKEEK